MTLSQKISLLTLVGLILPFGNIWGPLIIKVPKGSSEAKFRFRLIIFESVFSFILFSIAIMLMTKAILSEYNTSLITSAAYVLFFEYILILIVAIAATLYKKNEVVK